MRADFGASLYPNAGVVSRTFAFVADAQNILYELKCSFSTGDYECKIRDNSQILKIVFRQKSKGPFLVKSTPLIRVTPVKQKLSCEVGKQVRLSCSVNNPYTVEFRSISAAGKHEQTDKLNGCNYHFYLYYHIFSD